MGSTRSFVAAKIANARTILLRFQRDHTSGEPTKIPQAIIALAASLTKLKRHSGLEQILGIEGEAAKTYFGVFDELILSQKWDFFFRDRSGRPSLALDFMEEFRSWIVDRFVLKLINLGQVKGKDMVRRESGAVEIKEDVRKELIKEWQDRKKETIQHPFLGEKAPIGMLPFLQPSFSRVGCVGIWTPTRRCFIAEPDASAKSKPGTRFYDIVILVVCPLDHLFFSLISV